MTAILDCRACGLPYDADTEPGCWLCVICGDCCPAAGRCADCEDARRDDYAQLRIDDRNERGT